MQTLNRTRNPRFRVGPEDPESLIVVVPPLFCHGRFLHAELFLQDELRERTGATILYVPLPGHGSREVCPNRFADAVEEVRLEVGLVVKELEPTSIRFIGTSVGAAVAIELAWEYQEHCASLTLVSPFLRTPWRLRLLAAWLRWQQEGRENGRLYTQLATFLKRIGVPGWFLKDLIATRDTVITGWLRLLQEIDVRWAARELEVPVHIVQYEQDSLIGKRSLAQTAWALDCTSVQYLKGKGHGILPGTPAEQAELLLPHALLFNTFRPFQERL